MVYEVYSEPVSCFAGRPTVTFGWEQFSVFEMKLLESFRSTFLWMSGGETNTLWLCVQPNSLRLSDSSVTIWWVSLGCLPLITLCSKVLARSKYCSLQLNYFWSHDVWLYDSERCAGLIWVLSNASEVLYQISSPDVCLLMYSIPHMSYAGRMESVHAYYSLSSHQSWEHIHCVTLFPLNVSQVNYSYVFFWWLTFWSTYFIL